MSEEAYRWTLVDDFVVAINEWKARRVYPGSVICVDESIIRWYGIGGDYLTMGCPHYVMIATKPDAGIEVQTSACGKSGVLCQLRLMKSKEEMARENARNQVPPGENAGTTTTKQLSQPWHRSNRVVVGDSAFASVATAVEMSKAGLGFVGCVKTATKSFPNDTLKRVQLAGRGDYFGMMTLHQGIEMLAFTWCDRDRRTFISTAGSLAKADEQERFRYRPIGPDNEEAGRVLIGVDMPLAAEIYYSANGAIDFNNRIRAQEVHIDKSI